MAALVARNTPITILSPLLPENGRHPSDKVQSAAGFTEGSSAFALEIAIAIKVGYTLNFSASGEVKLLPPSALHLDVVTLPTRGEQTQIYNACCACQAKATQRFNSSVLSSGSKPTMLTFSYNSTTSSFSLSSIPATTNAAASYTEPDPHAGMPLLGMYRHTADTAATPKSPAPASNDEKPPKDKGGCCRIS